MEDEQEMCLVEVGNEELQEMKGFGRKIELLGICGMDRLVDVKVMTCWLV